MSKTYNTNELHGKVINYSQIKNLPNRNAFLEPKIFAQVSNDISTGNTLLFMPNGIHEAHLQEKKYDKSKYSIVLFGVLLDGRKATVVVSGIKPYFEVMVPNDLDAGDFATTLYNNLKQKKYACPE